MSGRCGYEVCHRAIFVNKGPDEATRLCERQRVKEHMHGLVPGTLCLERERLEDQYLEPRIFPPFCLHLLPPRLKRRQRGRGVVTLKYFGNKSRACKVLKFLLKTCGA